MGLRKYEEHYGKRKSNSILLLSGIALPDGSVTNVNIACISNGYSVRDTHSGFNVQPYSGIWILSVIHPDMKFEFQSTKLTCQDQIYSEVHPYPYSYQTRK